MAEEIKTYTQEEVDALLQAEADRRVSDALKKAEKKKLEEIKEAEKLARMNESERYQHELEQREAALAEKEKKIALMEQKHEASKILSEKGLPTNFVDFIVTDSADTTKANIDAFENAFKATIKTEIEKRLSSNTPRTNVAESGALTKDAFMKMNVLEQQQIFKSNPELYKQLTN